MRRRLLKLGSYESKAKHRSLVLANTKLYMLNPTGLIKIQFNGFHITKYVFSFLKVTISHLSTRKTDYWFHMTSPFENINVNQKKGKHLIRKCQKWKEQVKVSNCRNVLDIYLKN
jgi:hypothetical protein